MLRLFVVAMENTENHKLQRGLFADATVLYI
jgi:hypothetical protein